MIDNSSKVQPKDQIPELDAMAEYYAQNYSEIYYINDLKADCVVAVECYPHSNGATAVDRGGRKLDCFNYKNRLLSSRERLDRNKSGKNMIGYESIFGNDTRVAAVEAGEIIEIKADDTQEFFNLDYSSPFEKHQVETAVRLRQAESNSDPDYEEYTNKAGNLVERYETFERERIR